MEKTMKINKLQGFLLVFAGIILLSAMCFAVVFANFAITDKVASAEELDNTLDYFSYKEYDDLAVGDEIIGVYFKGDLYQGQTFCPDFTVLTLSNGFKFKHLQSSNDGFAFFEKSNLLTMNSIHWSGEGYPSDGFIILLPLQCSIQSKFDLISMSDNYRIFCEAFYYLTDFVFGDYSELLARYNTLESQYNELLSVTDLTTLYSDVYLAVKPFTYTGSDYASSGFSVFENDYTGLGYTTIACNLFDGYSGTICAIDLGRFYSADTKFRLSYNFLGQVEMSGYHLDLQSGCSVGYFDDNNHLVTLFTTSNADYISFDNSIYKEFIIPVEVKRLLFFSSGRLGFANCRLDYYGDVNQTIIDQAFQRGVDSVNTQYYIDQGYQAGYYAGLSDDNPYTFRSLMGAVVDAPLDVFTQMFDFDILGVNMKGLYLSLFTLALVILVIKFALARG